MRSPRVLAIGFTALSTACAAALIGTGIPAHAATAVNYVALGDSYSSGVGTGTESGSCGQSPDAYGPLWAAAHDPASFTFAACGGATTSTVISTQLSSLSSSTTLVSLTIGGNDVGFSTILDTCVEDSDSDCDAAIAAGETYAEDTLPGDLDTLFSDIHADAPNAKIIFLDYPDFYDTSVSDCTDVLDASDRTTLDNGINLLDGVLQTAAIDNHVAFADVRGAFSGHEICDSDPWLHSFDTTDTSESFHPTADGQSDGYLPVFAAAAASVGQ